MTLNAAAIVVGVDAYASIPGLKGCVQDALEVVGWLGEIGVPTARTRLHIAPIAPVSPPPSVTTLGATRDEIWGSFAELNDSKASGDALFVFLSGHGFYLAETGPIFLAQDYSEKLRSKNLDIYSYADFLQGLNFTNVLLIVDACQNYDVIDPVYRSAIAPSKPDDARVTPDPRNGVLLCCAAEQEQTAPVLDDDRGLLTQTLIRALRAAPHALPPAAEDALVFDWTTGEAAIDFVPLYRYVIAPAVEAAATAAGKQQNPTMQPRGRLASDWRFDVCKVVGLPTVPLTISAQAIAGLQAIRISLAPPARELDLPLAGTPSMPFQGFAPLGRRLIANCIPKPGWDVTPPSQVVAKLETAAQLHFDLAQSSASISADTSRADFNIKMIDLNGALFAGIHPNDYTSLQVDYTSGLDRANAAAQPDVPFIAVHETGPDVLLNGGSFESAQALAQRLRDSLTETVAHRVLGSEFHIIWPGESWAQSAPNLRLDLPPGDVRSLLGFLADEPLIQILRPGRNGPDGVVKALSANELAARRWLRLEPGSYRLVVDAPWGLGLGTFTLDASQTCMAVPAPQGDPPLRNRLNEQEVSALVERGPRYFAPGEGDIVEARARYGGCRFAPWPHGTLLFDDAGDRLRIEPFATLGWREWDHVLGAGRLGTVRLSTALERLSRTARRSAEHDLLTVGLAYAAWAQRDRDALGRLLDLMCDGLSWASDIQLLNLALDDRRTGDALTPPCLRWGAGLAADRAPNTCLPGVLEPSSIWAVFRTGF